MKDQFIPCDEAVILKELGFNEPCLAFYNPSIDNIPRYPHQYVVNESLGMPTAPLWQQAFHWFTQIHWLKSYVSHAESNGGYKYVIWKWNHDNMIGKWERLPFINSYLSEQEAKEALLSTLIKILKDQDV